MRIGLLGGLNVEHDGRGIPVTGAMQLAVLFRLAVDAGSAVSYRAISEDIWGMDVPENTRAALQSIVSRLRSQLPAGTIESTAGGYRLSVARSEVDALVFTDLVASAAAGGRDAAALASEALALWAGEPWIPSDNFDWFVRDLQRDHARALELGGPVAATASSIPAPLTQLVGRADELRGIADQLEANRLVTIIGTGGAGKTRLALEAASRRRGSILVELAPVGPSEVANAVLAATGREIRTVESGEVATTRDRVLEALAGRDLLLVLDNCEHVIDAAATLAQDLLSALPLLRILATSREPLGIPGEAFVAVGSLPHPDDAAIATLDSAELAGFAAIELFCQRATAARGVALEEAELRTAARICARLDGLPLAIELAAARLRTMGVDEVLTGLEDRFTLLTGGFRTALPRHQTLRAMIDWSWSLLDADERRALSRFAVFPAGVSAADSRELAAALGLPSASVFESLVDRSLLQRVRGRFRALETIREYGIEQLAEDGTLADAREAQARYLLGRTSAMDLLLRGPRIIESIDWFDAEDDNITTALRYTTSVPLAELAVGLAVACTWYWVVRDRNDEAQNWLATVAPLAREVAGDEAKFVALVVPLLSGFNEFDEVDTAEFAEHITEMLVPLKEIRVGRGGNEILQLMVPVLDAFAAVIGTPAWMSTARLPDGDDLDLDPWPTAVLLVGRAAMAQNRGEIDELGFSSGSAIEMFEANGDLWGLAISQQMRAHWLMLQGLLVEALEMSDASTENMRHITSSVDLAQQEELGIQLLWRLGRKQEARTRSNELTANAEGSGNSRALLQSRLTALQLDLAEEDLAAVGNGLTAIEEMLVEWRGTPGQMGAVISATKAAVARLRGDFALAENHLRDAAGHALRSQDNPVIGAVAYGVAALALARGDVASAVRAVDVASALIGAFDATNPNVVAVIEAADRAGIERPGAKTPDRPKAVDSLKDLLGD